MCISNHDSIKSADDDQINDSNNNQAFKANQAHTGHAD